MSNSLTTPLKAPEKATIDGNTAVAHIAYRTNEICAIYPITPSSTMAELVDQWASEGIANIWGNIPVVQEMQSEGGAAGTLHGALQSGALATTFTASQGLLLMIPNMYKIAGELTSAVIHVASRAIATQALSIFGDHSDVMAVRGTGFALLAAASVQEAHDMALIAQAATLATRVPFLHFFDGFRVSHEVNTIELISDDILREMIDDDAVRAHRQRALNPEHPFIRGTAHNQDTFFQARETVNPFYTAVPATVQATLDRFAGLTGRHYQLFEYEGHPQAERVVIAMGSGAITARETVRVLNANGEKVGVVQVRLYRPLDTAALLAAIPVTATRIAVIEQVKEPGAAGEPLYLDVVSAFAEALRTSDRPLMPAIIGGRYGLASKDFQPSMVAAVFDALLLPRPRHGFTVGIVDDVTHTNLPLDEAFTIEPATRTNALFYGLGADGTVGANKNSVKILAEQAGLYAQGYFVYDSHKSGAQTISHLRFDTTPVNAPYLIREAQFVACHHFDFLARQDVLRNIAKGGTFLLNAPYAASVIWEHLPREIQHTILDKKLRFFVIDASRVARECGLPGHANTVLQTCFFAISNVLPAAEAITHIKHAISKTYGKKGSDIVARNHAAVDASLAGLQEVTVPEQVSGVFQRLPMVAEKAPKFVRETTARMMEGMGDALPVSAMPVDGTFPSATSRWEKRNIAEQVPQWDASLCIQCGKCSFVCPHSVIRAKSFHEARLQQAPDGFSSAPLNVRGFPEARFSLQMYLEDCTGCGLCVETCPAHDEQNTAHKALDILPKTPDLLARASKDMAFFEALPNMDRSAVDFSNVRGVQFLQPLFEFPGACAGCGETPYLKLLSQLFGDRAQIANATGCSSIYGGNLPVTPWSVNDEGRGPAWSNSLFEDNAEFGLGFRLTADKHVEMAKQLLKSLAPVVGEDLVAAILNAPQQRESEIRLQRERVALLRQKLLPLTDSAIAKNLLSVLDQLVRRSVWIVGGDGWAYDIDAGGLDHVLSTGRDVNILVLDTEVYSNTGGQASKATPLAVIAKFAAGGKQVSRKDLALQAISYGNVYVAQVALGANPQQTLEAFREAEAFPGTSLIIAYSHCIAHGIDMQKGLHQQHLAVESGYWPLFRYNPLLRDAGENSFRLDSLRPSIPLRDYAYNELRYRALDVAHHAEAEGLLEQAQKVVVERYETYEEIASGNHERLLAMSLLKK